MRLLRIFLFMFRAVVESGWICRTVVEKKAAGSLSLPLRITFGPAAKLDACQRDAVPLPQSIATMAWQPNPSLLLVEGDLSGAGRVFVS